MSCSWCGEHSISHRSTCPSELGGRIDALEEENGALKERLAGLEERIDRLESARSPYSVRTLPLEGM